MSSELQLDVRCLSCCGDSKDNLVLGSDLDLDLHLDPQGHGTPLGPWYTCKSEPTNYLYWWWHLVNAHEGKAGMVLFAGKTAWSMPQRFECTTLAKKAPYKYSSFPFLSFIYTRLLMSATIIVWCRVEQQAAVAHVQLFHCAAENRTVCMEG